MERSQDMKFLVEKLFNFLGSLLSTCSSDLPLLRGVFMNHTLTLSGNFCVVFLKYIFKLRLPPHRGFPAKEEVPPSGVSHSYSQQHVG